MKINLVTPAYGDSFSGQYVQSFYRLIYSLARRDVLIAHTAIDYADIVLSRNYLLTNFYFSKRDCSHILFVDNDMGFEPKLVEDMLDLGQPVVGAFIPSRQFDWEEYRCSGDVPQDQAVAKAMRFVGRTHPSDERLGEFVRADRCGTGIMLISREAITEMIEKLPQISAHKPPPALPLPKHVDRFLTPFDKVRVDGHEFSEDYSFCWRWTEGCNGKIWAAPHHMISHTGRHVYKARFADRYEADF